MGLSSRENDGYRRYDDAIHHRKCLQRRLFWHSALLHFGVQLTPAKKKREADNPTRPYFSFGESLAMSWIPFINVSERRLACDIKKASCRQRKIDSGRIREIWWEKQPSWKVGGEKKRQLIRDTKEKRRLARIITETRMCNPFPQPAAHRSGASKVSAL